MEKTAMEKLIDKSLANTLSSGRKNFSEQADAVIKKIEAGKSYRSSDLFILFNTDQKQIDDAIMLDDIQDRVKSGKITHEDVDFLVNCLGDVGQLDQVLRKSFYIRADEINYAYALNNPQEFTASEIENLKQKVNNTSSKMVLKEELEKL